MVSEISPIKFHKNGINYEDSSFNSRSKRLGLNSQYIQEFLNEAKTTYYSPFLAGQYGFETNDGWNGVISIENCTAHLDEIIKYTQLNISAGTVITVVVKGQGNFVIIGDNTGLQNIIINDQEYISYTYTTNADYDKVEVEFNPNSDIYVQAIGFNSPTIPYEICNINANANLIGISPYGGVYLLNSRNYFEWIDFLQGGNQSTDIVNEWEITVKNTESQEDQGSYLKLKIGNGTDENLEYYQWSNNGNSYTLEESYNWIDHEIVSQNASTITYRLKIPSFLSFSVEFWTGGLLDETYTPSLINSELDDNYIYIGSDGQLTHLDLQDDYFVEIGKVGNLKNTLLKSYKFLSNPIYEIYENQNNYILLDAEQTNSNTSYIEESLNNNNSVYAQIGKFAYIEIFNKCCQIQVDDYISEPFIVVAETTKRKITYSDSQFRQNLVAGYEYNLWVDSDIRRDAGSITSSFEGERRNYTLKGIVENLRKFKTKRAIPDYLSEILEGVFNCENVQIEGVNYDKSDDADFSYLENSLWTEFEITLRKNTK